MSNPVSSCPGHLPTNARKPARHQHAPFRRFGSAHGTGRASATERHRPTVISQRIAAEMDGNLVVRVAACAAPEQGDLCAARAWPTALTGALRREGDAQPVTLKSGHGF